MNLIHSGSGLAAVATASSVERRWHSVLGCYCAVTWDWRCFAVAVAGDLTTEVLLSIDCSGTTAKSVGIGIGLHSLRDWQRRHSAFEKRLKWPPCYS